MTRSYGNSSKHFPQSGESAQGSRSAEGADTSCFGRAKNHASMEGVAEMVKNMVMFQ